MSEQLTEQGYEEGLALGRQMAEDRAAGDGSYDCRYDLADAARQGTTYFQGFRAGLDAGLKGV